MRILIGTLLLAAGAAPLAAQSLPASPASSTERPGREDTAPKPDASGLLVSGASRLRYESVSGRPRPGFATSEDAVLLRTGVAMEYGPGPLSIGGELIDSRAYDLSRDTLLGRDDVNAVELPQAYLRLRLDDALGAGRAVAVEAGRFLINYGSGRLVATDEYRNTVNGFTGIEAELKPDRATVITLFYVLPQERLPSDAEEVRRNHVRFDRETFDDRFFGFHAQRKGLFGGAQAELAYYRLAERDSAARPTADRRLHTVDARLYREPKAARVDYDVEGAYQFGEASASNATDARHADVSAGLVHVAAGYSFPGPLKPRIGLFYDYATGDHGGGRFNRFDTLFGSRREDFGPSGTYAVLARENISAPGIRLDAKPDRAELLLDYRGVWLASRTDRFSGVTDDAGGSGRFAGQQIDGRLRYWLVPDHLRLEGNVAVLFKGRFLRDAPAALARDDRRVALFETNLEVAF